MKIKIVFASMTGNDEDIAEILEEDLQDAGFDVSSSDVSFADASEYLTADLCVFVTYTYGEGVMTDEVADFYDQLKDLDLSGKSFAVLGSGDKTYRDHYCETVMAFQKCFLARGAKELVPPVKIENGVDEKDIAVIDQTAKEMNQRLNV